MIYNNIHKGIFRSRPNRFIAEIEIDGKLEICHVKNTGRCKELLVPGAAVYANYADSPSRSTKYGLIAVHKGNLLINMDSLAPNRAFGEYLQQGRFLDNVTYVKSEARYGGSRFDFYVETATSKTFIEVKGVTLEENGVAMFPDAPTERGIKHLNKLAACVADGYNAYVVFVIQIDGATHSPSGELLTDTPRISYFTPNYKTHPAFGDTLAKVAQAGVHVLAFDCKVKPDEMVISKPIPIKL